MKRIFAIPTLLISIMLVTPICNKAYAQWQVSAMYSVSNGDTPHGFSLEGSRLWNQSSRHLGLTIVHEYQSGKNELGQDMRFNFAVSALKSAIDINLIRLHGSIGGGLRLARVGNSPRYVGAHASDLVGYAAFGVELFRDKRLSPTLGGRLFRTVTDNYKLSSPSLETAALVGIRAKL